MSIALLDINEPICFCEEWAVGIPLIDSQHLRLFEMVEDLRLAVVSQADPAMVTKVLKGLVDYCGDHFECEHMIMQTIDYPGYRGHYGQHQQFTDQALRWFAEHQRGTLNLTIVLQALIDWLIGHILDHDKKIAECCVKKNIDCNKFQSVSDVIPKDSGTSRKGWLQLPVEVGMILFMVPMVGLLGWLSFWEATAVGRVVAGFGMAVTLLLDAAMVVYVRKTLSAETRQLQLAHSKQLADNMLASEIAKRIAVMHLDDIDKLFVNESSPLVGVLQEIVDHLKTYVPYLQESLLALVRGEEGEGDVEADGEVELSHLQLQDVPSLLRPDAHHSRHGSTSSGCSVPPLRRPMSPPRQSGNGENGAILKVESIPGDPTLTAAGFDIPGSSAWDDPRTSGTVLVPAPARKYSVTSGHSHPMSEGSFSRAANVLGIATATAVGSGPTRGPGSTASSPRSDKQTSRSGGELLGGKKVSGVIAAAPTAGQAVKSNATKARSLLDKWLKRKVVSVMVADVSGFNDLANTMPTDQLLVVHSTYVTVLEDVGKATKGTVQSLVGDRVILSWNAASAVAAHAMEACRAALMLRDTLAKKSEFSAVRVKVAVGTGSAQVGNIGSKAHLSFSIVGPVMLVTSALCKLNAFLGTDILISSNTWRDVKGHFVAKIVAQVDMSCSDPTEGEAAHVPPPAAEDLRRGSVTPLASRRSVTMASLCREGTISFTNAAEIRRMFALHLLKATEGDGDGEWMYVLQQTGDPFSAYHEAVLHLFYGSFEKGYAGLQEYVRQVPNDPIASELLSMCERATEDETPEFSWIYGWAHP